MSPEVIVNPYGLAAMWSQGDWVAKSTLIIMLLMSVSCWYVIVTKWLQQRTIYRHAQTVHSHFWRASSVESGLDTLESMSVFRTLTEQALKADDHHEGTLTEQIDRHTWLNMNVERSVNQVQSRLQDGLALLATVGSTAPFVGLFGTVWGIYNALTAIGVAGQASMDKMAGPLGEALIMTAIGLAVAVPAVMGYNWLVRRNKLAMEEVRAFAADLYNVLLARKRAG